MLLLHNHHHLLPAIIITLYHHISTTTTTIIMQRIPFIDVMKIQGVKKGTCLVLMYAYIYIWFGISCKQMIRCLSLSFHWLSVAIYAIIFIEQHKQEKRKWATSSFDYHAIIIFTHYSCLAHTFNTLVSLSWHFHSPRFIILPYFLLYISYNTNIHTFHFARSKSYWHISRISCSAYILFLFSLFTPFPL